MAAEDNVVYGFDKPDSEALIGMLGTRAVSKNPQDLYDATRLVLAYTAAGATARSGTTLGKGTATLQYLAVSGTDRVITASTDTDPVTYYNLAASVVDPTKYLMLLRCGDVLLANWEEC
jgi:hypothetical protein